MGTAIRVPKGETIWISYYDKSGERRFIITSKALRDQYYLYEVQDGGVLKKLGKARSPDELVRKYKVEEAIGITGNT